MIFSVWLIGILVGTPVDQVNDTRLVCGPVAVYAALETLGVEARVAELEVACGWQAETGATVEGLMRAIQVHDSVECRAGRMTSDDVFSFVRDGGVAILLVRGDDSGSADHAICLVETDGTGLIGIEYPEGRSQWSRERLSQFWDGESVLVRRRADSIRWVAWGSLLVSAVMVLTLAKKWLV